MAAILWGLLRCLLSTGSVFTQTIRLRTHSSSTPGTVQAQPAPRLPLRNAPRAPPTRRCPPSPRKHVLSHHLRLAARPRAAAAGHAPGRGAGELEWGRETPCARRARRQAAPRLIRRHWGQGRRGAAGGGAPAAPRPAASHGRRLIGWHLSRGAPLPNSPRPHHAPPPPPRRSTWPWSAASGAA